MSPTEALIHRVARALGRRPGEGMPPAPPTIDEPTARLVHADVGLPELFAAQARANGMVVHTPRVEELVDVLMGVLEAVTPGKPLRIGISGGGLLDRLGLADDLRGRGLDIAVGHDAAGAAAFGLDVGMTDVDYAVAETGSLVILPGAEHPRGLSLQPPVHIAVIEPRKLLPDLLDLMEVLKGAEAVIVSGPSKTADIEMELVVGVHGPGVVHAILLS